MNKGFRNVLIASAVVLLVGFGLIVAGVVAGASWRDVGDVILSDKYSFGNGVHWGVGYATEAKGNKLDSEENILKEVDAKSIEKLTINMEAGNLEIKEGKSAYFQMVNKKNRGDCYVDYNGNELTITIRGKNNNSRGARATFWIPKGLEIANIEVKVDAGRVTTEDINATDLTITVGAGQVKANAITAKNLSIEVDAGEFKNTGNIVADEANLRVAAGQLKVDMLEAKHVGASVDVGNMNIKFAGAEEDYDIDAECDLGELKIGDKSYHIGKEYQSRVSNTDKTIKVECSVGKATIGFEK